MMADSLIRTYRHEHTVTAILIDGSAKAAEAAKAEFAKRGVRVYIKSEPVTVACPRKRSPRRFYVRDWPEMDRDYELGLYQDEYIAFRDDAAEPGRYKVYSPEEFGEMYSPKESE